MKAPPLPNIVVSKSFKFFSLHLVLPQKNIIIERDLPVGKAAKKIPSRRFRATDGDVTMGDVCVGVNLCVVGMEGVVTWWTVGPAAGEQGGDIAWL